MGLEGGMQAFQRRWSVLEPGVGLRGHATLNVPCTWRMVRLMRGDAGGRATFAVPVGSASGMLHPGMSSRGPGQATGGGPRLGEPAAPWHHRKGLIPPGGRPETLERPQIRSSVPRGPADTLVQYRELSRAVAATRSGITAGSS